MKLSEIFKSCLEAEYTHLKNDADLATVRAGSALYIYFEKSASAADWKNNLDFPARCNGCIMVHRGFLRVWESARDALAPAIRDRSIKSMTVVGYSHGAALAVLCHSHIWCERPDLRDALFGYGFGCPRVVWGRHPKEIWRRFTVVYNRGDPVHHLPPAILGYRHVGNRVSIGSYFRYRTPDAHRAENIYRELVASDI